MAKGYRVVGTTRAARAATDAGGDGVELRALDLEDAGAVRALVAALIPDEVYHLAAASRVDASWEDPAAVIRANAGATATLLDAVRRGAPAARVVLAASAEVFGEPAAAPQSERTPIAPVSPYGTSKAASLWLGRNMRERYGLHVASAILFNHESPRRPPHFVTRKITRAVARIARGELQELRLGSLESRRDWGYAGDYVEAMWRMAQRPGPEDLVIGTGTTRSVREFCEVAFGIVGLDARAHVRVDPALVRPREPVEFVADASRAAACLGWRPEMAFDTLVAQMVAADLDDLRRGASV